MNRQMMLPKNAGIKVNFFFLIYLIPIIVSCHSMNTQWNGTQAISHELWDQLLKSYVDDEGMVNYKALKANESQLDKYLDLLKSNGPNENNWSEDEQLAYWINAYNAFTIKLILKYYPIKSIKDIGSTIQIPFVNTAWDIDFIMIGDEDFTLNNIEHFIIRKDFEEPRIHFALVCAAKSCPKLRNEAYTANQLDEQLTDQTKSFLANPDKNKISEKELKLSKIFSWYGGDFTQEMSLVKYLNQFTEVKIDNRAKINFMDYDWSLNEQ